MPRNVILIGYRGTGKTTVARLLATHLGWDSVDADQFLEMRHAKTISQIFEQEGEAGFREKEAVVLADLCQRERHVIATGGGAILREANRVLLKGAGFVVWIRVDADTIWARLASDPTSSKSRPSLTNKSGLEEVRELVAFREPLYRSTADLEIDAAGLGPEDVAKEILTRIHAA
jgi:shikimate kinase